MARAKPAERQKAARTRKFALFYAQTGIESPTLTSKKRPAIRVRIAVLESENGTVPERRLFTRDTRVSYTQGTRKMNFLVMTGAWNGYGTVLCHGCIEWKGPPSRLVMNMGRGAHSHGFFGALALPLNVLPP